MRFSSYLNEFGRRAVPFHWKERNPKQVSPFHVSRESVTYERRAELRKHRNQKKQELRNFRGDWGNFIPAAKKHGWLD